MTDAFDILLAAVGIICDAKERRRLAEKANDDCEEEVEESEKIVFRRRRETRSSSLVKKPSKTKSSLFYRLEELACISCEEDERRLLADSEESLLDHLPQKPRSSLNIFFGKSYIRNHEKLTRVSTCLSSLFLETAESEDTENRKRKKRAVPQSLVRSKIAKVASSPRQDRETPEWLLDVMREMRGAEGPIRLIYKKPLTPSDVEPGKSRLLIPFQQLIRNDFLTHAESQAIWNGLGTILVNQRSEQWDLRIKIWVMKKKKDSLKGTLNYILNRGWNDVVKGNRLKAGDKLRLWTFRCRGVLCFALDTE
ncbi:PREDICTED: putative B3 domain-containing protein At3g49610 [Camelina sativa]|uniref:B3 domain-containing protein At3g49610 n=1 Tax=Camelina sativa TaxID=90675 RepID=A0ABM0SKW6_CAMSA|nr:PREDICTED: putative B3 domain-containing protein At3g49610 [Camelina sativa]